MNFENSKHHEGVSGKLPEWRASDGIYREKKAVAGKDPKNDKENETLKGYVPSAEEKKNKNVPKKIMDIENSYGTFSIGVNDKKQMVTLTTQQRTRDINVMRGESKQLRSSSAINLQKVPGDARTNSSREKESAVEYVNDAHRQVPFLLERMDRFVNIHDFNVQEDILPFMFTHEEKSRLQELREKRKELSKANASSTEKNNLENEIEYYDSVIRDKDQELQRTRRRFMSIRKDALDQREKDYADRLLAVLNNIDVSLEDGTGDPEDNIDDMENNAENSEDVKNNAENSVE